MFLQKTNKKQLKLAFDDYNTAQDFIEDEANPDDNDKGDTEDQYQESLAVVWELMDKLSPPVSACASAEPAPQVALQLPKINIRTFTREIEEYTPLFISSLRL